MVSFLLAFTPIAYIYYLQVVTNSGKTGLVWLRIGISGEVLGMW
jgi:hypothetical protein